MVGRYVYCPMTARKIGHRTTLLERFRRRRAFKRACKPDLFPVCGYNAPVYPGK